MNQDIPRSQMVPKGPLPEFTQPPVRIGQEILYYDDYKNESSNPVRHGWVTSVNDQSVNVSVMVDGAQNLLVRNGVRHIKDPNQELVRRIIAMNDGGLWDYREKVEGEAAVRILALEETVADLKTRIANLEKRTAPKG